MLKNLSPYKMRIRFGSSSFSIEVRNPGSVSSGVLSIEIDGAALSRSPPGFPLVDDGNEHEIVVTLGD
jgi:hypothetical protein